ncbi:MAG: helix-turn-helix domain-containing protein [Pirellulales bacterium]
MTVYTVPQLAEMLQAKADTIRQWIVSGRLPALNLARPGQRAMYRVTAEQLAEFQGRCAVVKIEKSRRKPTDSIPFRRYA